MTSNPRCSPEFILCLCWWSSLFRPGDGRNDGVQLRTWTHETSPKKILEHFLSTHKSSDKHQPSNGDLVKTVKCLFGCFCLFLFQPFRKETNQSIKQTINLLTNQPTNQSIYQPTNQPTNQFKHSTIQSINQSITQSTSGTLRRHLA